jgi:cyclopropane-fatty-acyl-phospholipid synthase
MGLIERALRLGEMVAWPDPILRQAIGVMVARTDRRLADAPADASRRFALGMDNYPIALHAAAANEQHYELPQSFFGLVLGQQRKYSCCLFGDDDSTLDEAAERALQETAEHAGLADGQRILELGCGWGSLSLWMAENFPNARITSVSNSNSQREYIVSQTRQRGLANLEVVTADMNDFSTDETFDRIVSVEMFEHMANWRLLLARVRKWLKPDGRAFVHVFTHARAPYRFDHDNPSDWIAHHFFTGGIMPSHRLMHEFPEILAVEQEWNWNDRHYKRTADAWLANFDARRTEIDAILREVYGKDAALWRRRWRLFFLATAGLFGHNSGKSWGVSHYRLAPA